MNIVGDRRSKNHHFVPKILQKQFLAEPNKVWFSERQTEGRYFSPELRNIRKTFRIKNLYTVVIDGQYSDLVERNFYGQIDNFLGELIPHALASFDRKMIPLYDEECLSQIRKTVMYMLRRTPDYFGRHADEEQIGRDLLAKIRELSDDCDQREELLAKYADPVYLNAISRDVRVRASIRDLPLTDAVLPEFCLRWAVSQKNSAFILSSKIAYQIGATGLGNPLAEIWMPIAPRYALVLVRDPNGVIPRISFLAPAKIREVNEFALRSSTMIASHSQRLLESLIKT